jgi:hypothetical protein
MRIPVVDPFNGRKPAIEITKMHSIHSKAKSVSSQLNFSPLVRFLILVVLMLSCFALLRATCAARPTPTPTPAPTPSPTPTPAPTPTPTPAPGPKYLHFVYTWPASAGTSYLGAATKFLGTTVWGQVIQPTVSGTLYFANNISALGAASVDVLVGQAQNDGKWTGPSVDIICYADWNPQYAAGSAPTLTVTRYDPAMPSDILTATVTITPGGPPQPSKYTPVPGTNVATITYNADGTFTIK